MSAFTISYRESKQRCLAALDDAEIPTADLLPIIMEASTEWPINREALERLSKSQLAVDNRRVVRLMIEKNVPDERLRLWVRIPLFPFVLVFRILAAILRLGRV